MNPPLRKNPATIGDLRPERGAWVNAILCYRAPDDEQINTN